MIDHVEGAENLLYASDSLIGQEEFAHADNAVKIAQVHATLALAAEQRTANLLSYWSAMTDEEHGVLDDEGKAKFRQIALTIESRLGLTND